MLLQFRFFFLCFCSSFVHTANIFAIIPYPAKSHNAVAEPLLKRLAGRGHYVDFATHYPTNATIPGYNEINLVGSLPLFVNNMSMQNAEKLINQDILHFFATTAGVNLCKSILRLPAIQNILSSQKKYDLFITELTGTDCFLGLAHVFNASLAMISTCEDLPWGSERLGNPSNPSYIPNFFVLSNSAMNLFERIENTIMWIYTKLTHRFLTAKESNSVMNKFLGTDVLKGESIFQKTDLYLVNSYFSMNGVRPTIPNFVEVGGFHMSKPKPLSTYFENLINTTSNGVIYLSMGSMLMSETFGTEKLQAIFDVFAELPYRVLWKADIEKLPKNLRYSENIFFEKWMPQTDILCHPKVKLFVTHGGLLGSQEAIYCGVPRLGIPIYADQEKNIRIAEKLGIGIRVGYSDINKHTILAATRKLLDEPSYRERVKKISSLFKDRPILPLDKAVYWVENVLQHNKTAKLRRLEETYMHWYHYYLIDVGLLVLFVTCVIFFAINLILSFFVRYCY